ncbi:hypothetical protein [Nocardiopsis sp. FR26]|uniref:hypothetical protein n=1 Tax=Nocardiopsis sp. FR26 TaxID=2605987 RepID=UPI00135695B0|nr:hypothetical protein [Nocardiopsis sp. FR26]
MKHPKTKVVARLRLLAKHATERADLRDKKLHEDHYEALNCHRQAAPQVRELLTEAENLLAGEPTAADFEQAKALIRRAERALSLREIPSLTTHRADRGRAEALEAAASLLEDSEGDTVTTSELERFGILSYLRV